MTPPTMTPPLAWPHPGLAHPGEPVPSHPSLALQTHCRLTSSSSGCCEHQLWVRMVMLYMAGVVAQALPQ